MKVDSSQHVESAPSEINANMSLEKSVEKKVQPKKDITKDLQRAKKALREKDKELMKLK